MSKTRHTVISNRRLKMSRELLENERLRAELRLAWSIADCSKDRAEEFVRAADALADMVDRKLEFQRLHDREIKGQTLPRKARIALAGALMVYRNARRRSREARVAREVLL